MKKKIYYLVRHAEKQDPGNPDTPISAVGRKRAIDLKNILQPKNIRNIIVSEFIRTQQTAEPLENAIHIPHTIIDHSDITKILKRLDRFSNSLLVGHTDNIPLIIKKLTGRFVSINEDDFDNLFIITITSIGFFKRKILTSTTYGQLSP